MTKFCVIFFIVFRFRTYTKNWIVSVLGHNFSLGFCHKTNFIITELLFEMDQFESIYIDNFVYLLQNAALLNELNEIQDWKFDVSACYLFSIR